MHIVAIGDAVKFEELRQKVSMHDGLSLSDMERGSAIPQCDMVIDLDLDDSPEDIEAHLDHNKPVLISGLKIQLAELLADPKLTGLKSRVSSGNLLRTFIDRPTWELASLEPEGNTAIGALRKTGMQFRVVKDRVGMVSARIVLMIINEACYTLQEGTAGKSEIDSAMKLGTNYPKGPFEWANAIGIKDVYEVLDALYRDTREERYKICPLLKTHYFSGQPF